MSFDLRLPIGIMFSLFGAMLTIFGFATRDEDIYKTHSLGININFRWGLVLLVFGLFMLFLARKGAKNRAASPSASTSTPVNPPH